MGYVPGQKWDIFLSYAHIDGAWVEVFRKHLEQALVEKLGARVELWQDKRDIVPGEDWPDEIRNGLANTAALVSILSPAYFNSLWCRREREAMVPDENALGQIKVGSFHRFLKVIKTPTLDHTEDNFYSRLQNVTFCSNGDEFLPGSPDWMSSLKSTTSSLAGLLSQMRNNQEGVYVTPSVASLERDWTQLRAQLQDYGYNVQPGGGVRNGFPPDYYTRMMTAAKGSVFLLGAEYDDFIGEQITLAKQAGSRMILWPHPSSAKADPKQAALLEQLRSARDLPPGSQLMGGNSIRDLVHDLRELLKPTATVPVTPKDSVYLLYDPTDNEDTSFANNELAAQLEKRKLGILRPDPSLAVADRLPRHEEMMRACSAVLLYRGPASNPDNWLFQTMPDILWAERKYGRAAMRAKTLVVDDPSSLAGIDGVDLIPARGFSAQKLDPFFARLEKA
jgi:hypothetical protein